MNIYLDESGEFGFHPESTKICVIALLATEKPKTITNLIRKFNGEVIKAGWPRNIEIKASTLYRARWDLRIPKTFQYKKDTKPLIVKILRKLAKQNIVIDAIIVNKEKINKELRETPYGILYNYYAGRILIPRAIKAEKVHIFIDKRNKEEHNLLHFDGYIETNIYKKAIEKGRTIRNLEIKHVFSHEQKGIQAVDYLCWSIFRYYEHKDYGFYKIIKDKISNKQRWYF